MTIVGRQDAVGVDEGLEDDAGRLGERPAGRGSPRLRIDEVVRRAERRATGSAAGSAIELGVPDDLGLLGGDRQDDDLLLAR